MAAKKRKKSKKRVAAARLRILKKKRALVERSIRKIERYNSSLEKGHPRDWI